MAKYLKILGAVALVVLLMHSCKKSPEKGNLKLQLKGYVGNSPLSFTDSIYNDGQGNKFYLSLFQFYAAHFVLVKTDLTEVEVDSVAFFDYSAANSNSILVDAPPGNYSGIRFYVGLDPYQNSTNPAHYDTIAPGSPLSSKSGMYWGWLKHRFVNLEGAADSAGGSFTGGSLLDYHVGRDTCYRSVTLNGSTFTVADGATKNIDLNIDILKVFYGQTDTLHIRTANESGTQSNDNDLKVAIRFADLFSKAFTYSQ